MPNLVYLAEKIKYGLLRLRKKQNDYFKPENKMKHLISKTTKDLGLKIILPLLFLIISTLFSVLVGCSEMNNPMRNESFIVTNIDIIRTISSNEETWVYHQTNFLTSNQGNAVIYYTTNGFTNIPRFFLMNELRNYLFDIRSGGVTTNYTINTNFICSDENSFILTNITDKFTNASVGFTTNYFTKIELLINAITNTNWANWDFSGVNLSYLNLSGYNFKDANLSGSVLIGANTNGVNFTRTDLTAALINLHKGIATDGEATDYFGVSVSIDGKTAIIGATGDDNNGVDSGSAYIFTHNGDRWSQQTKLNHNDGASGDNFGRSVSINGDTAIVGAYLDDDNGNNSGSAYIFTRSGDHWSQQTKLTNNDGTADDYFGYSVSINGDTAIVGAYLDDDNGVDSGAAYIFTRSSDHWSQQTKLTNNDGTADDYFGYSVSINGDTAIVGAYRDDDNGNNSGAAYIFTRNGDHWSQQTKLTNNDGTADDYFGYSVSINGDTAIVGAYRDDDNGNNSGAAYIFTRNGDHWSQQTKLTNNDGTADDYFGYSVSINGDNTVIVGAYRDDDNGNNSGAAYIFTRNNLGWFQRTKLTEDNGASSDYLGYSVSINGKMAIVGAYQDDDNGNNSGSAFMFEFLEIP